MRAHPRCCAWEVLREASLRERSSTCCALDGGSPLWDVVVSRRGRAALARTVLHDWLHSTSVRRLRPRSVGAPGRDPPVLTRDMPSRSRSAKVCMSSCMRKCGESGIAASQLPAPGHPSAQEADRRVCTSHAGDTARQRSMNSSTIPFVETCCCSARATFAASVNDALARTKQFTPFSFCVCSIIARTCRWQLRVFVSQLLKVSQARLNAVIAFLAHCNEPAAYAARLQRHPGLHVRHFRFAELFHALESVAGRLTDVLRHHPGLLAVRRFRGRALSERERGRLPCWCSLLCAYTPVLRSLTSRPTRLSSSITASIAVGRGSSLACCASHRVSLMRAWIRSAASPNAKKERRYGASTHWQTQVFAVCRCHHCW